MKMPVLKEQTGQISSDLEDPLFIQELQMNEILEEGIIERGLHLHELTEELGTSKERAAELARTYVDFSHNQMYWERGVEKIKRILNENLEEIDNLYPFSLTEEEIEGLSYPKLFEKYDIGTILPDLLLSKGQLTKQERSFLRAGLKPEVLIQVLKNQNLEHIARRVKKRNGKNANRKYVSNITATLNKLGISSKRCLWEDEEIKSFVFFLSDGKVIPPGPEIENLGGPSAVTIREHFSSLIELAKDLGLDYRERSQTKPPTDTNSKVIQAIIEGNKRAVDISTKTGLLESTTHYALKRLVEKGIIYRTPNKEYSLCDIAEPKQRIQERYRIKEDLAEILFYKSQLFRLITYLLSLQNPTTESEIAKQLGLSKEDVETTLEELRKNGGKKLTSVTKDGRIYLNEDKIQSQIRKEIINSDKSWQEILISLGLPSELYSEDDHKTDFQKYLEMLAGHNPKKQIELIRNYNNRAEKYGIYRVGLAGVIQAFRLVEDKPGDKRDLIVEGNYGELSQRMTSYTGVNVKAEDIVYWLHEFSTGSQTNKGEDPRVKIIAERGEMLYGVEQKEVIPYLVNNILDGTQETYRAVGRALGVAPTLLESFYNSFHQEYPEISSA